MQKRGVSYEKQQYPGTQHGYFNDTSPDVFNEEAADRSWRRSLEFFRQHL
jgi:carboxymethylenebutenolidase